MGLPIPNLDDKTFDELVQEARSLIARYAPEWTDYNIHDPGITFIELFAWLAEMQIYQLNRVTDKTYRKFLKLVGFHQITAQPARVGITFNAVPDKKTIPAGMRIVTEVDGERIVFETEEDFNLIPSNLEKIIIAYDSQRVDNAKANETDGIYFAAFGKNAPVGAILELGFDSPPPEEEIQITFVMFEEDLPSRGSHADEPMRVSPSINVVWEYLSQGKWNELTLKKDTTSALTGSGKIVFIGPSHMDVKDGLCWIRCRLKSGHYEIIPLVNRILINTVPAVQIETIKYEDLGTGRGIPELRVLLKNPPVIRGSQVIQVQREDGEWENWEEVVDLELSGPNDRHYIFDPEKGEVMFGNGLNGRFPLEPQEIKASYKATLGQKGNITKGQKFWIEKSGFEGIIGENLKEATGGKAAETIEHAKNRTKKDFRTPYRMVTTDDYEYLAISTPGLRVARAKAIPNYNPAFPCISDFPGAVTIVVVPYVREGTATPVPGEGFLQTALEHLNRHRLVTTDLYVIGPEYVKISVMCNVHLMKKSSPAEVEKRVKDALKGFLDPLSGGTNKKGWPFGRAVYPSEIYQIVDGVEGVDYVTNVYLSAASVDGQYQRIRDAIKISPIGLVFSGDHKIITTDLQIEYLKISVKCKVHIKGKSYPLEVKRNIQEALKGFLDPIKGGPDRDGWPPGYPVKPSEICTIIGKVDGIDRIEGVLLCEEGQQYRKDTIKIPPTAYAISGEHQVEIL